MARLLPLLIMIAAVVAVAFWISQRSPGQRQVRGERADASTPEVAAATAEPGHFRARAKVAAGPERGPGELLLTESQLVFRADAGRVLVIERLDIVGVGQTADLPDRRVAHPVLVVSTADEVWFFEVANVTAWEYHLTRT